MPRRPADSPREKNSPNPFDGPPLPPRMPHPFDGPPLPYTPDPFDNPPRDSTMPQPLPQQPGRQGMGLPDMSLISALMGQDMQNRGEPYSPGGPQARMQAMQDNPAGALPSIGTSDLLATSNEARQGGNMDVVRALRSIIEGRTSDDFARGPGPRQPNAQNKTSAEKIQTQGSPEGWGVLGKLNAALFGANNRGN